MRVKIKNYSSLKRITEYLLPYFVGKTDQAKLALEFANLAGQRGKLIYEDRVVLMNKMKELNQRGHVVA